MHGPDAGITEPRIGAGVAPACEDRGAIRSDAREIV